MQIHRFYCEKINQPQTELTGAEAHHLINVMRLNSGDKIELFDGKGTLAKATVEKIKSNQVTVAVDFLQISPESDKPRIVIASSIAKSDRFDIMIAKCTELGADRITPVIFERTVKQPKNPKITERWKNITISSAKQCKRLHLPKIDLPLTLSEALEIINADYSDAQILFGDSSKETPSVMDIEIDNDVIVFIGPEGGITDTEVNLLHRFGAKPVRLTDTILRTETAAIALAAILSAKRHNINATTD
ncbi:MAG: 16S rRNA (uracil(1498)-N(3))-methyltransferase [Sedimentisphaerales bacterium]|nr:16S rRNA (uracil(1498)-N(3))-methyltransferase [Sedimentisphaerales bacterium]